MKKTFSHDGDRLALTNSTRLGILSVVVLSMCLALVTGLTLHNRLEAAQKNEFEQQNQFRLEQLGGVLLSKTAVLESAAALLPLASELDQAIFSERMQPVVQSAGTDFICWHDINADQLLRYPAGATECDSFVLFRTTTPLTDSSTAFLFSLAAGGLDTPRSGFISIKLDLSGITSIPGDDQHTEFLYIRDRNALELDRFRITEEGLSAPLPVDFKQSPTFNRIANVLSFDDIELIYDIHYNPTRSAQPYLAALATLLASLLLGSALLFYWWKNRVLARQIHQRTDELRQFAYRAAHDMKSPLTGIRQIARFVQEDVNAGDYTAVSENVDRIATQSASLEAMLSGLYNLSLEDPNHTPLDSPYPVQEVVESIIRRHSVAITKQDIDVSVTDLNALECTVPRARLEQILDNLISNAIKYSDPDDAIQSHLKLGVSRTAEALVFTVSDNGVGLDKAFFEQHRITLFKRYRPDLADGSGIGLSITIRHVFHLSGSISFEQLQPGTRVIVSIPSQWGKPT